MMTQNFQSVPIRLNVLSTFIHSVAGLHSQMTHITQFGTDRYTCIYVSVPNHVSVCETRNYFY